MCLTISLLPRTNRQTISIGLIHNETFTQPCSLCNMIICLDRGRKKHRDTFHKKRERHQLLKLNKAVNYFTRVLTSFFNLAEAFNGVPARTTAESVIHDPYFKAGGRGLRKREPTGDAGGKKVLSHTEETREGREEDKLGAQGKNDKEVKGGEGTSR